MTTTTHARARVTGWFAPDVHPVRDGVYQLHNTMSDMFFYARWTSSGWCVGCTRIEDAGAFNVVSVVQDRWPWRGMIDPDWLNEVPTC
jgi:hypothetical protein